MLRALAERGFDIAARNHAEAILARDFPEALGELVDTLADFRIEARELLSGGGGEAVSTQRLRRALADRGWRKHNFVVETLIDGHRHRSTSHEIDHVRHADNGTLALEIEWNNKDPFFDRDLENFQRLHGMSAISVGIVITRGGTLQEQLLDLVTRALRDAGVEGEADLAGLGIGQRTERQRARVAERIERHGEDYAGAFARSFVADKYGAATTHWAKLMERVERGVGNPCPLLLIGLPASIVTD